MHQPSNNYVFMSYSRKDNVVMQRIVTFLRKQGVEVWVDNEKLTPGTPVWEKEIEKAVQNASAVVVLLSPDSKDSEWVRREISLADQYRKRVFPMLVRGDEEASISLRLINRQFVDVRENEDLGLSALETALSKYLYELRMQEQKEKIQIQKPTAGKADQKKPIGNALPIALIGLGFLFIVGILVTGTFLAINWLSPSATPALTETPIATKPSTRESTALPVATDTYAATETSTATQTATATATETSIATEDSPTLDIGSTMTSADGMTLLYIPPGEFTMGSNDGDLDERPVHTVNLDAFWIDKTEVTNKMYSGCVTADACKKPAKTGSVTHSRYYGNSEFDNYPVIYVDWNMAKTYCEWAGRELPTEAQWEKVARGADANIYPWGNTFDGKFVNFCDVNCLSDWAKKSFNDNYIDISPSGNYPSGKSAYGALDMAGNVWEWVNDWYDVYPGGNASASSNFGQKYRVLRGGSWYNNMDDVRSTDRYWVDLSDSFNYFTGFRCSYSP